MTLTAGLVVAALGSVALVAPLLVVLLRETRRLPATTRSAFWFLTAGAGCALGGVVLLAVAGLAGGGIPLDTRVDLSGAVALGGALVLVTLVVGLLRLPGLVATDAARLRHTLDGLTIAVSAFMVVWLLVHVPAGVRRSALPHATGLDTGSLVLGGSGLTVVAVLGILGVTVFRATIARRAVLGCALAVIAVAGGVHGLAAAVRVGAGGLTLIWILAGAAGLVTLLGIAAKVHLLRIPAPEQARTSTAFAVVPTFVALGALLLYAGLVATPDRVAVFGAVVLGFGLAGRQAVAHREIQAQAVELAAQGERFRTLALTDPLTSLANRRRLLETLRDHDESGEPCVLIAIDLDGFKNVNDMRGHDTGDLVLGQVARRLREAIRPGDLAARLGGDEFAVVVHAPLGRAQQIAERLLTTLSAPYEVPTGTVFLSASIGLAGTAGDVDMPALLHNADVALRSAKQRGKNRVERYAVADERWLRRRTALEEQLRGAVERGELSVAYQPVIDAGLRPVAVEALLRWHSPILGAVPTAEFIAVAEEAGLITGLDRWALHQASYQLAAWLIGGHDLDMHVNVSVDDMLRPEYPVEVTNVLRLHHVPPRRVVLEVAAHDPALAGYGCADRLAELRATGLRIALDDFGAGHSSFRHISDLPIDMLKINAGRMLGLDCARDDRAAQVVSAVAGLGRGLGLAVVAHGISRPEHRAVAAGAGIRLTQGDLFVPALPAEHAEAVLTAGTVPPAGDPVIRPASPPPPGGELPRARRAQPYRTEQRAVTRPGVQDLGQVDSGREMRQS